MAAALRGRGDCGRGLHPCAGQRLPSNPNLLRADVCRRVLWAEGGRGDCGSPGFGAPSCAVSLWDPESGLRCELRTGLGLPLRLLSRCPGPWWQADAGSVAPAAMLGGARPRSGRQALPLAVYVSSPLSEHLSLRTGTVSYFSGCPQSLVWGRAPGGVGKCLLD